MKHKTEQPSVPAYTGRAAVMKVSRLSGAESVMGKRGKLEV